MRCCVVEAGWCEFPGCHCRLKTLQKAFIIRGIAAVTVYAVTACSVIAWLCTDATQWRIAWNDCCGSQGIFQAKASLRTAASGDTIKLR